MFDLSKVEVEKGFSPIKPGAAVPVVLEKIEISEKGDLDFHFRGTSVDNAGVFKPRFWANSFDPSDAKYNVESAEKSLKQIRRIIDAYLPASKSAAIKGNTWMQFAGAIKATLTPDVFKDVPAFMKILLQRNSDTKTTLPLFGDFISTAFNPTGLSVSDKLDNNGIPYERILPLSEYGIKPSSDNSEESDSIFGDIEEEDIPAFGK